MARDRDALLRNLIAGYGDSIRLSDIKANIAVLFVAIMSSREHNGPCAGKSTRNDLDVQGELRITFQSLKVGSIRDTDVRHWPSLR